MIQAACEGMIDFRQADLRDPWWWRKLRVVIDYVGRQVSAKLAEHKFQFNLAVLSYLTHRDTLEMHWDSAEMLRSRLCRKLAPWLKVGPEDVKETLKEMRDRYIETWGDPNDPTYQAEMQRLIQHWRTK